MPYTVVRALHAFFIWSSHSPITPAISNEWLGFGKILMCSKCYGYLVVELRFKLKQIDFRDIYFSHNSVISEKRVVVVSCRTCTHHDDGVT